MGASRVADPIAFFYHDHDHDHDLHLHGLKTYLALDAMNADTEMQGATTAGAKDDEETRQNEWVRIESNDGFSYLVRRKVAETSGTTRNMLDPNGGYAEAQTKICNIDERGIVTEKLVEYMCFKAHYQTVGPKEDIPVQEMQERIPPEIVLEVLLAADYQEM